MILGWMRWVRHAACMKEIINSFKILVRIAEGRAKCRWEGNIRMGSVDWINLA
jgi:hypothetical protein